MKRLGWIVALVLGSSARLVGAAGLPGPLVTPQWLQEHLDEVTVVDIRDDPGTFSAEPKFETDRGTGSRILVETGGHIAGALAVDFNRIREERIVDGVRIKAQLPTAEHFAAVMDDAGLSRNHKPIVIVPTGESVDSIDTATRLYFQLRYFGEARGQLAILNGGVNAYLQAGFPVSTAKATPSRGDWAATGEDSAILATLPQVKEALAGGSDQLIDARPTPQFLGIVNKPITRTGGHLAGARSFPPDAIARPRGAAYEFMTAGEYAQIYAELNIRRGAPTVTYCNTGHLASGAWFVAREIMGNENARLYAGSMTEWTNLGNPTVGVRP